MQIVTAVKFNETGKIYFFEKPSFPLQKDDKVIVDTQNGIEVAIVTKPEYKADELDVSSPLRPIIRKASGEDLKKQSENNKLAQKNIGKVKEAVKNLNLTMNIVNMEYSIDGSKIIINFTSEDRVDFRDLLKDLASIFHSRIELRQIGIRDEVKTIGGLGPCGQPCCCKRFLNEFEHVSVKMAKNQGLSLNPTKISGLCGRLMCCLGYEDNYYAEVLKRMPKINSQVKTPEGIGTVTYNDILKEIVSVKFYANDTTTLKTFELKDITVIEQKNYNQPNTNQKKGDK